MRELALFVFDVLMGLVLFVVGVASLSHLGFPSWLTPISLLPLAFWIKWRAPELRWNVWGIIAACAGFTACFMAWHYLRPFGNGWGDLLEFLFAVVAVVMVVRVMRTRRKPANSAQDGGNQ